MDNSASSRFMQHLAANALGMPAPKDTEPQPPVKTIKAHDIILRHVGPYGWLPIIRVEQEDQIFSEVYRGEFHIFPEAALETAMRVYDERTQEDYDPS